MKRTANIILLSIALLTALGCEKEPEIMDEELYKTVLTELSIVNQMDEELFGEKSRLEKREDIFSHYGISEELFELSHEIYQRDIDAQMERIRDVQDRLRTERDSVQAAERRYRDANRPDADSIRRQIRDRRDLEDID
ncbi:DUF4296 domain-containing protein [Rhodohalobacter halophilus]|uniref:DUF4296 domain-containing protein n=1 Tax=Rhodohalobacter halophilus TaxID=1812810 RepID=UPI00083F5A3F|nr:DUF4296 domain-containing protein [Rhodohalobacter halophilus]